MRVSRRRGKTDITAVMVNFHKQGDECGRPPFWDRTDLRLLATAGLRHFRQVSGRCMPITTVRIGLRTGIVVHVKRTPASGFVFRNRAGACSCGRWSASRKERTVEPKRCVARAYAELRPGTATSHPVYRVAVDSRSPNTTTSSLAFLGPESSRTFTVISIGIAITQQQILLLCMTQDDENRKIKQRKQG